MRVGRVLRVDVEGVDPASPVGDPQMFFRHGATADFRTHDLEPVADALRQASRYATVLEWLGVSPRLRAAFEPRGVGSPPHEDGYSSARDVRRVLGNREDPIRDIKRVERDAGALVVRHPFQTSALRALTAKQGATVAVLLTSAPHGLPRRIDLAHELAHVLLDAPRAEADVWIDLEDAGAYERDPTEQRARAFAAELLVPLEGLRARYGAPAPTASLEHACRIAREVRAAFRVTAHVAANHLVNHGYVPATFREALLVDEMRIEIEEDLDEDALTSSVREAVEEGLVSRARALELLGLTVFDELP